MDLQENLKKIGLGGSETKVYLYVLGQGISTPSQIAKGTGIARTNCYHVLLNLKNKGLLEEQAKGKRKAYLASDPDALLRALERRKEAAERIIPDLRALYTVQKNKPKITFYDGLNQIEDVYRQTLSTKEVRAIASTDGMLKAAPEIFEWYGDEILKRDMTFKEIATHASCGAEKKIKEKLGWRYEYRLLEEKYGGFETDLLLWDDCIATITFEEPYFATIVQSNTLSKTYTVLFNALWDTAKMHKND